MSGEIKEIISFEEARRISSEKDTLEVNNLRERVIELEKRAKSIEFAFDIAKVVVIGILVVFFIAFLGFVVDAWRFHATAYNEYRSTVQSLKDEIQQKKEKDVGDKFQKIQQDVDSLWKTKYPVRK